MMDELDFIREYPALYAPETHPMQIVVPPIRYFMVDGEGDPQGQSYQEAIQLLYTLSFMVKMSKRTGTQLPGYQEYVTPPPEGLWDLNKSGFDPDRSKWKWTLLIRQPEFVTEEIFLWAREEAKKEKPTLCWDRIRLSVYEEGLCVQVMHLGPYTEEQASIDKLLAYEEENDLLDDCGSLRRHHEIYLSDPRSTAPERLKTVLRHPVVKKSS